MSRQFELTINIDEALRKMDATGPILQDGIRKGAHDVLNLWQAEARDDSPIDTGTLRRNIEQQLRMTSGLNADLELTSNAYKDGFNYAYYQHEVRGRKYLNTSAERNISQFEFILENEARKAVAKAGW